MRRICLVLAFLFGTLVPVDSTGEVIEIPVLDYAVVSNQAGDSRILVNFGDLSKLTGKRIAYAKCSLKIVVDTCEARDLELEIRPLIEPWSSASLHWEEGWDSAGQGVLAGLRRTERLDRTGEEETQILMTEVVRAWMKGRIENYGCVIVPHERGCGYRLVAKQEFPGAGIGKLKIVFFDA